MEKLYLIDKQGKKRKAVEKICKYCSKPFLLAQRFDKPGRGKYCSTKCQGEAQRKRLILKCFQCGEQFERTQSKLRSSKSKLYFCCRACKDFAQSLEGNCKDIQPIHYGTGKRTDGYREKALKQQPNKCNRCGYNKYIQILQVHHIDRNGKNKDIDNLEILCPNCHYEEHFLAKDGVYWNLGD